jgi:cytidine deaminase
MSICFIFEYMLTPEKLLMHAESAMASAYAPYSEYKVGSAVETDRGIVFSGCNIENAAYTPTIHAEQVAISDAVSLGHTTFVQIAVVTSERKPVAPCGLCRQVIREFAADDILIHLGTPQDYQTTTLGELLPDSFGPDNVLAD